MAVIISAGARAEGGTLVEPIARLSLEGGYDSNVLYDGNGGDSVGVVSPDLGFQALSETMHFRLSAGGDLMEYRQRRSTPLWNQRGSLLYDDQVSPRLTLHANANATYAADPIGLARLGIFNRTGAALIGNGAARATWRLDERWSSAFSFSENVVRFDAGDGTAAHEPGIEATRQVTRRFELGGGYRFDYFQGLGAGSEDATAHELRIIARYRWTRRVTLQAQAGPALWTGNSTSDKAVLPQGSAEAIWEWRGGGARASIQHGLGLGNVGTPGIFDAVEVGATTLLSRHFQVHADGGLWRSGAIPWGTNSVLGYGVEGELAWLLGDGFRVGVAASRFARADTDVTAFDRNLVGLRFGWELKHH
jgi:hypothetical protein